MPAEASNAAPAMMIFFMKVLPDALASVSRPTAPKSSPKPIRRSGFLCHRRCREHRLDRGLSAFVILIADRSARTDGADHVLADEDGKAARLREIADELRRAIHLLVDAVRQLGCWTLPACRRFGLQLRRIERRLHCALRALKCQQGCVRI